MLSTFMFGMHDSSFSFAAISICASAQCQSCFEKEIYLICHRKRPLCYRLASINPVHDVRCLWNMARCQRKTGSRGFRSQFDHFFLSNYAHHCRLDPDLKEPRYPVPNILWSLSMSLCSKSFSRVNSPLLAYGSFSELRRRQGYNRLTFRTDRGFVAITTDVIMLSSASLSKSCFKINTKLHDAFTTLPMERITHTGKKRKRPGGTLSAKTFKTMI